MNKKERLDFLMKKYSYMPTHLLSDDELDLIYSEFNKYSIIFMTIEQRDFLSEIRLEKQNRKAPNPFIIEDESNTFNDVLLMDEKLYLTKGEEISLNRSKAFVYFNFESNLTPEILIQYQQFLRWLANQKRYSRRIKGLTTYNSLSKLPKKERFSKFLELYFPLDLPIIYYDGFIPRTLRDIENETSFYQFLKSNVFRSHGKKKEPYSILKTCLICSYVLENKSYDNINKMNMNDLIYLIKDLEEKHYFHGKKDRFIIDFNKSDEKIKLDRIY